MPNTRKSPEREGGVQRLLLSNVRSCRKTMARLVQDFFNGRIDADRYRLTVYGISNMVPLLKLEADADFEKRLSELESKLAEAQK